MFDSNKPMDKILNPLNITKNSIVEFKVGELANTGIYRFKKIIEFMVGPKNYVRYLIYSKVENSEFILEVFPEAQGRFESYLLKMKDTIPFDEGFLEVAGQQILTTPEGIDYERCIMPEDERRLDGVAGRARVYDIDTDQIQKEMEVSLWDYQRDCDGKIEYLNIEQVGDTGMFRIFTGEMIEDIFYKVIG